MFLSGSSFFPSFIPTKACGNEGLAIYFMLEVLEGAQKSFRCKNEEVLKFYGGKEL
jgi:hypothetical protein